jgi:hypothetical protein
VLSKSRVAGRRSASALARAEKLCSFGRASIIRSSSARDVDAELAVDAGKVASTVFDGPMNSCGRDVVAGAALTLASSAPSAVGPQWCAQRSEDPLGIAKCVAGGVFSPLSTLQLAEQECGRVRTAWVAAHALPSRLAPCRRPPPRHLRRPTTGRRWPASMAGLTGGRCVPAPRSAAPHRYGGPTQSSPRRRRGCRQM